MVVEKFWMWFMRMNIGRTLLMRVQGVIRAVWLTLKFDVHIVMLLLEVNFQKVYVIIRAFNQAIVEKNDFAICGMENEKDVKFNKQKFKT
jgi:hypothetical protein